MLLPVRLAEKKLFLYLFIFPLETGKGGEGTASFSEAEAKEISAHPLVDGAGLPSSIGAGQRRTRHGPGLPGPLTQSETAQVPPQKADLTLRLSWKKPQRALKNLDMRSWPRK